MAGSVDRYLVYGMPWKQAKVDLRYKTSWSSASITGTIMFYDGPRMPGPLKLVLGGEDMLRFHLLLPEVAVKDVVSRELTVRIGHGEDAVFELTPDTVSSPEFFGEDNTVVFVRLVDVDDAGNRSEPREQQFVLLDTIPPPQPGEIGLQVIGETDA